MLQSSCTTKTFIMSIYCSILRNVSFSMMIWTMLPASWAYVTAAKAIALKMLFLGIYSPRVITTDGVMKVLAQPCCQVFDHTWKSRRLSGNSIFGSIHINYLNSYHIGYFIRLYDYVLWSIYVHVAKYIIYSGIFIQDILVKYTHLQNKVWAIQISV